MIRNRRILQDTPQKLAAARSLQHTGRRYIDLTPGRKNPRFIREFVRACGGGVRSRREVAKRERLTEESEHTARRLASTGCFPRRVLSPLSVSLSLWPAGLSSLAHPRPTPTPDTAPGAARRGAQDDHKQMLSFLCDVAGERSGGGNPRRHACREGLWLLQGARTSCRGATTEEIRVLILMRSRCSTAAGGGAIAGIYPRSPWELDHGRGEVWPVHCSTVHGDSDELVTNRRTIYGKDGGLTLICFGQIWMMAT
ncbi:hypothetical protein GUJ93_ZPchr0006g40825 [Zizania palustris]|uniref:Uncharacterized protein n=1 Tax=Zizania palustris TaxID=103762 RepID=A0A8J5SI33_ZIZPA|nr:hypothetical protein GUJ93_ZPchr0006g40825 [Zizania palustris]